MRVNSLARTYRVRGLLLKAREALILAEAVQKLMYPNPNKQLITLQKKLRKNQRQRKDLEHLVLMAIERIKKKASKNKEKKIQGVNTILTRFRKTSAKKSKTQESTS